MIASRLGDLLVLSTILILVGAYSLDKTSCGGIMNYMTDTVTSAFGMIEGGQQALDKHPIDHEVAELAGWLFAKQDFDVVEQLLLHMSLLSTDVSKDDKGNLRDPVIYCSLRRFLTSKMANDQTVAVDTDIGIATVTDRTWYTCMDPHQYAHSNEFVPKLITIHNTDIGEREQIQICPWSLRARTAWFNMGEADFVSHLAVDTPEEAMAIFRTDHISDWALLDFDLVHEFSHVYGTEDHAYTWQDCLNLSDGLGAENANSIAFFTLGVRLLGLGFRITRRGDVLPRNN